MATDKLEGKLLETYNVIAERHRQSNGKCGLLVVEALHKTGIEYATLKVILTELRDNKHIKTRKGLNGTLLFLT